MRLLLLSAIVPVALLLSGCVTIPLPPTGAEVGKYGFIQIGYVPNALTTPYLSAPPANAGLAK